MAGEWIVKRGDQQKGPFTSQQLKSLASAGKLKPTDLVGKADGGALQPASKVKGLLPAAGPAAAPTAQPQRKKPAPVEDEYGVVEDDPDESGDSDDDEYDEPAPTRKKRPPGAGLPPRSSGKKSSTKKTSAKGKSKGKKEAEADDGDGPPWANLAWGIACLAFGIFLFVAATSAEASGEEIDFGRKGGIIKLVYGVLGRWGVLAFFLFASFAFFGTAIAKWKKK